MVDGFQEKGYTPHIHGLYSEQPINYPIVLSVSLILFFISNLTARYLSAPFLYRHFLRCVYYVVSWALGADKMDM